MLIDNLDAGIQARKYDAAAKETDVKAGKLGIAGAILALVDRSIGGYAEEISTTEIIDVVKHHTGASEASDPEIMDMISDALKAVDSAADFQANIATGLFTQRDAYLSLGDNPTA